MLAPKPHLFTSTVPSPRPHVMLRQPRTLPFPCWHIAAPTLPFVYVTLLFPFASLPPHGVSAFAAVLLQSIYLLLQVHTLMMPAHRLALSA
ncbi:hypothetical protein B0H14DRAFT_3861061, partial [Mycena olivaceomarginata]